METELCSLAYPNLVSSSAVETMQLLPPQPPALHPSPGFQQLLIAHGPSEMLALTAAMQLAQGLVSGTWEIMDKLARATCEYPI